jgi:hypothetical protein
MTPAQRRQRARRAARARWHPRIATSVAALPPTGRLGPTVEAETATRRLLAATGRHAPFKCRHCTVEVAGRDRDADWAQLRAHVRHEHPEHVVPFDLAVWRQLMRPPNV